MLCMRSLDVCILLDTRLSLFLFCFSFLMIRRPPCPTLFPYTTLCRSLTLYFVGTQPEQRRRGVGAAMTVAAIDLARRQSDRLEDRKSTRLNSSHLGISYAVFCLQKQIEKKKHT